MEQIKIFEGNGNNETDINSWLRDNPTFHVVSTSMSPMLDRYVPSGDICNQWIATTVIYTEVADNLSYSAVKSISRYAWLFIEEHTVDTEDNSKVLLRDVTDLTDKHLQETFKDCAVPLRPIFYPKCKELITAITVDYKIED